MDVTLHLLILVSGDLTTGIACLQYLTRGLCNNVLIQAKTTGREFANRPDPQEDDPEKLITLSRLRGLPAKVSDVCWHQRQDTGGQKRQHAGQDRDGIGGCCCRGKWQVQVISV